VLQLHTSSRTWLGHRRGVLRKTNCRERTEMNDMGQLCGTASNSPIQYLVLRSKLPERDDWRTRTWNGHRRSLNARDNDDAEKVYKRRYDEALKQIYLSPTSHGPAQEAGEAVKEELETRHTAR